MGLRLGTTKTQRLAAFAAILAVLAPGDVWSQPAAGSRELSLSESVGAVLRARFPAEATDLASVLEEALRGATPARFDEPLAAAVRRFQERHGLEEDGVVGKATRLPRQNPVRVHVGYWTAWVGGDGQLRLGRDVYQRDAELARLLQG